MTIQNHLSSLTLSVLMLMTGMPAWSNSADSAEAPMDLICVTEIPTTSFFVKQDGSNEVDIRVLHHNGIKFAPFRKALITPYDLPLLQAQATEIEKLGDDWHFKWKRSSCNADTPLFFQCVGGGQDFESNGVKIHPSSLTVTEVEQKSIWGDLKHKNLSLTFNFVGDADHMYEVTMDYQPSDCLQSTDSLNRPSDNFGKLTKSK